jgi:hypothetical protein
VIFEGKLIAPWAAELRTTCKKARSDLQGRELVIDLENLTAISQEGENTLLELMSERVKFHSSGVFTKHVLRELARRVRSNRQEKKPERRLRSPAASGAAKRVNKNCHGKIDRPP